jgi:hypothetical protein
VLGGRLALAERDCQRLDLPESRKVIRQAMRVLTRESRALEPKVIEAWRTRSRARGPRPAQKGKR